METITIQVYDFDDLSEKVQAKVVERYATDGYYVHHDWHRPIYVDWKERLSGLGFGDVEIYFSGFYSQGDGASFNHPKAWVQGADLSMIADHMLSCGRLDLKTARRAWRLFDAGAMSGWIARKNSRYAHEYTCGWDFSVDSRALSFNSRWWQANFFDKLEVQLEAYRVELCKAIYRDLEKEYEWLSSYGYIRENLMDSGFKFLSGGEDFNYAVH
jgi:hypothetical protein